MTSEATITFSQEGVQPPVYVVTSLSGWITLEMYVDREQSTADNLVFKKSFADVSEGSYQYKIRIGEDHWVVDESKESATDDQGNRNNVVHVKPASDAASSDSRDDSTITEDVEPQKEGAQLNESRKDSTLESSDLPSVPVPFVIVEKVADKEQPAYGDIESESLPSSDSSKRAADAEPDFEEVKHEYSTNPEPSKSPEIPVLVVEKTDDKPAYGDDFGEDATPAQKMAHEMRTADASPDELVITPERHAEPSVTEAPPVSGEVSQSHEFQSSSTAEAIDNGSLPSSTDQTSSGDLIYTPSEQTPSQDDDESSFDSKQAHGSVDKRTNGDTPTESLPSEESGDEDADEFANAPLLPHESHQNHSAEVSDEEDEFGMAPLLPHESSLSDHRRRETTTSNGYGDDESHSHGSYDEDIDDEYESGTFERKYREDGNHDDAPLLPHERGSSIDTNPGSSRSSDDGHVVLQRQSPSGNDTDNAKELFGGKGRPGIFRARTNSSSLPHKLPRSDEEDENLDDPSLERFPTNREQILERVATIGLHVPEDEGLDDHLHSPPFSVLSQACSSVELAPVKSYVSLASVPEADYSDEEDDHDVESLPSPVFMGGSSARASSGLARDPHKTPVADDNKQLGLTSESGSESEQPSSRTKEPSEAENVDSHDGAKDSTSIKETLRDAIASPASLLNPITPPLTPERKEEVQEVHPVSDLDAELRERRKVDETSEQDSQASGSTTPGETDGNDKEVTTLPSSSGFAKRASASAIVLGAAVAAYYFIASS